LVSYQLYSVRQKMIVKIIFRDEQCPALTFIDIVRSGHVKRLASPDCVLIGFSIGLVNTGSY